MARGRRGGCLNGMRSTRWPSSQKSAVLSVRTTMWWRHLATLSASGIYLTFAMLAIDWACAASVYRSTPAALGSLNVPVIAHFEGGNAEGGGFFIVLPTRNGSGWDVIDGSTMAIRTISTDRLLRMGWVYTQTRTRRASVRRSAWAGPRVGIHFVPVSDVISS